MEKFSEKNVYIRICLVFLRKMPKKRLQIFIHQRVMANLGIQMTLKPK